MMTVNQEPDSELEHVVRSRPPWRRGEDLTECGKPATGLSVITRDGFIAKVRKQGQQRSAMTTCMVCWRTARSHPSWEENPVLSLIREARRFEWHPILAMPAKSVTFRDELLAIAALIDAHRDDFDALLAGLGDTVCLDEARQKRLRLPAQ